MKTGNRVAVSMLAVLLLVPAGLGAQSTLVKIGSVHTPFVRLSARIELWELTVERDAPAQLPIVALVGDGERLPDSDAVVMLKGMHIEAELSGPGLSEPLMLPGRVPPPSDPLVLKIPALSANGTYQLSNIRVMREDRIVMEVSPGYMTVKVVDPTPMASGIVVR
jgi:hypothetical protein